MRAPIGKLLVEAGLVTQQALDDALRSQAAEPRRLGEILVARGLVTNVQLTQILSHQLSLPWVSLAKVFPDAALLELIPRALAERHLVLPVYVRRVGGASILYVATDDPTDEAALAECAAAARMEVRPMVAASDDLRASIAAWYGRSAPPSAPPSAPSGAMRVAAAVAPLTIEPPAKPAVLPNEIVLDDDDVAPYVSAPPEKSQPVVLVVGARGPFLRKCRFAAEAVLARVEKADLSNVAVRARELQPFALVVPEEVYAFDRLGLSKLAVEVDALLVLWSDDLEAEYLEPLLDTAVARRAQR